MAVEAAAAAASQAAGGVISSLLNMWGTKKAQKREFAHNQQMAEYAYSKDLEQWNRQNQYNLDMWNMENAYNSPEATMKRLTDAGLNPHLVATNGATGGPANTLRASEMPKYNPARANYTFPLLDAPNMLSMYQNFRQSNAQLDLTKAQEDLTKEKALTEAEFRALDSHGKSYENAWKHVTAKYSQQFAELDLQEKKKKIANMAMDKMIKNQVHRGKKMEGDWMEQFGMRGSDPLLFRSFIRMMQKLGKQ